VSLIQVQKGIVTAFTVPNLPILSWKQRVMHKNLHRHISKKIDKTPIVVAKMLIAPPTVEPALVTIASENLRVNDRGGDLDADRLK